MLHQQARRLQHDSSEAGDALRTVAFLCIIHIKPATPCRLMYFDVQQILRFFFPPWDVIQFKLCEVIASFPSRVW